MILKVLASAVLLASLLGIAPPPVSAAPSAEGRRELKSSTPLDATVVAAAAADAFPVPATLEEGVAFWKRVWSEWTLSQIVLHDNVYHQIVYDVFELPGVTGDVYTEPQRDFIKARREALQERLENLEAKIVAAEPLDDGEKELALVLTNAAGAGAIEGAHKRVRSQRGLRERFLRGVAISGRYIETFKAIFRQAGLPEDLAYLPHVESSFQMDARSSAGAVGMWQFTRPAAKIFLTMTSGVDERLDPVAAARGAARYMKRAFDELGNWSLAVTSYNHGIAGMRRAKERYGNEFETIVAAYDGKTFGFASRNFYMSFVAARDLAKAYESDPPPGLLFEPPVVLDRIVLDAPSSVASLERRYGVPPDDLAALNRAWTRNAVSGATGIPAGVHVWLPAGTLNRIAAGPARPSGTRPAGTSARAGVHTVAAGDTLGRIARQYGVPLSELLAHNGLRLESVVRPGQRIRIPSSN